MNQAVHIVDSLALGGAQRVLKTYFESEKNNRNAHLLSLREVDDPVTIDHRNVKVSKGRGRYSLRPIKDIARLTKGEDITIVHCHLFRAQIFGLLIKIGSRHRCRLIFHEHGRVVGKESESYLEHVLFRVFLFVSQRWVDQYICNSKLTKECLVNLVSPKRPAVIVYNPIILKREVPESERDLIREKMGIPKHRFVVGFAGRLIRTKGWRDFLEAVSIVSKNADISFLIAGVGPDLDEAKDIINRLGLDERGQVMGHVHDMTNYFAALDCFVMPSLWESHGIAHLEAQAARVPIIVSDIRGLRKTVRPGVDAMLCSPGDSLSIAESIIRLKENAELRDSLVVHGLTNVERFSLSGYKKRIHNVERELS
jgi:L-malate glycosyltransferase